MWNPSQKSLGNHGNFLFMSKYKPPQNLLHNNNQHSWLGCFTPVSMSQYFLCKKAETISMNHLHSDLTSILAGRRGHCLLLLSLFSPSLKSHFCVLTLTKCKHYLPLKPTLSGKIFLIFSQAIIGKLDLDKAIFILLQYIFYSETKQDKGCSIFFVAFFLQAQLKLAIQYCPFYISLTFVPTIREYRHFFLGQVCLNNLPILPNFDKAIFKFPESACVQSKPLSSLPRGLGCLPSSECQLLSKLMLNWHLLVFCQASSSASCAVHLSQLIQGKD